MAPKPNQVPGNSSLLSLLATSGWIYYILSVSTLLTSGAIAVRLYPGWFDWQYTVVSALASYKHNPAGGAWFAGGIGVALLWLWPFANRFRDTSLSARRPPRKALYALRCGIVFGALMAIESIVAPELPPSLEKTHEALALFTFLFCYLGILGLSLHHIRREKVFAWPIVVIILPLVAIGISQFSLYLSQRDLGWVDHSWRDEGIPVWLSFAFWQWLALAALWIAVGALGWMSRPRNSPDETQATG